MIVATQRVAGAKVVLLGPALSAVSGVSTHLNMLLASDLAWRFRLSHFQVGAEGRHEGRARRLARLLLSPLQLAGYLLRHRPAIVHLNTSMDAKAYWRDLIYLLIAKALGCKVVYQVHGGALPERFFARSVFLSWLLRLALRMPDSVIVLSREELAAYRRFVPGLPVYLVPNAIDPRGLGDVERCFNTDAPLRLVYVGRLARAKGIFDIVEAAALLKSGGLEFRLSIAGDGPDRDELAALIVARGVSDRVVLLGPVFGLEKNHLWCASDLFLFPTFHAEGLPYAVLEAMAAACVLIVSPVAAIADVVKDAVSGVFVPAKSPMHLAEAVRRIDQERLLLRALGTAGRDVVLRGYTLPTLSDSMAAVYAALVNTNPKQ
jgi:glycosyltransferase involved in cell wall biosynthesis